LESVAATRNIIGLISDTHGLLRSEALIALRGADLIIHAGDVGKPDIIDSLKALALVIVVRGNIDTDAWASSLPETAVTQFGGKKIYVLHNIQDLAADPVKSGFHVVVSGHSHQPGCTERDGVLYINPGSAGPRRFKLPITIALLDLGETPCKVNFVDLSP
jgi:putative phosphoesterase